MKIIKNKHNYYYKSHCTLAKLQIVEIAIEQPFLIRNTAGIYFKPFSKCDTNLKNTAICSRRWRSMEKS